MRINENKKIIFVIFVLCILMETGLFGIYVDAAEKQPMIRVGLTGKYKNQDSIVIKNTMLTCGYWSMEQDTFVGCEVFTSKNGFTFASFKKGCYVSDKAYSSYAEVSAAVKLCESKGISAYAALLHENCWKVYITGSGEEAAKAATLGVGNFSLEILTARFRILVTGSFGRFVIDVDDARTYPMFAPVASNTKGDYVIELSGSSYRGYIEIGRYGDNGVTAVNVVPMEEYLYGVVPSEVSYTWPIEMLKAQAVAARSYAAAQDTIGPLAHISSGGYTLEDTVSSQVYGGYNAEKVNTTQAVDATCNEKLYYNGTVIKAYYFSTSGGSTEDAQAVWNVPIRYFRQVSDVTELSPAKKPWIEEYNDDDIEKLLIAGGYSGIGVLKSIKSEIITESGRIYSLKFRGSRNAVTLQKTEISTVLELPSTKFKVIKYGDVPDVVSVLSSSQSTTEQISNMYILSAGYDDARKAGAIEQYVVIGSDNLVNYPRKAPTKRNVYYFAGMGYGHGVGMSQSGAAALAEEGYDYKEILSHYYTGVEIR